MKILALDLGDVHTGTAISDHLNIIAKPYKTIKTEDLESFIKDILEKEQISTIIIGYPKTMMGKISAQTQKVIDFKKIFEKKFPNLKMLLWDERLSSKQAERIKKSKNKQDKIHAHSISAALILSSYLESLPKASNQDF